MIKVTRRSFVLIILSLASGRHGYFVYRLYEYGEVAGFEYRKFSAEVYDRNGIPMCPTEATAACRRQAREEACFRFWDYSGNVEGGYSKIEPPNPLQLFDG